MNRRRIYMGASILCLALLWGCAKTERSERFDGIVRSHVDSYQSGTGSDHDLIRDNQLASGFDYGDAERTDWKSTTEWKLIGDRGESDMYRFKWTFSPSGGAVVSRTKNVEYDGKGSIIVFRNEWETVSIEPGSVPLPAVDKIQ